MSTLSTADMERELLRELETNVRNWVNTFNYLDVKVLEKYTDNSLFEYILPLPLDTDEWFNQLSKKEHKDLILEYVDTFLEDDALGTVVSELKKEGIKDLTLERFEEYLSGNDLSSGTMEFRDWLEDEKEGEIREYFDSSGSENYPMWNTCFEFKDSAWNDEETIAKIQDLGMGVIQHEDFNTIIFMMSAGHSFYSSYWIPLYLNLFTSEAEKFKGVNYQGL